MNVLIVTVRLCVCVCRFATHGALLNPKKDVSDLKWDWETIFIVTVNCVIPSLMEEGRGRGGER